MKTIITGSDFSGVGAFDQALNRLGIKQNKLFACDWDKYARQTYIYNFGEPAYYPSDVYDRQIPAQSLDIYMTSPPCQSFSLAGKRQGENSDKGILFYNSHEFIVKNKPRFFIFENVKGLLSDNGGKTFKTWIDRLGGKTVNGNPVIFPHEKSVPYHVYHQVLNAKNHGVPQNRERVFIIGIRDDADNEFSFPKPFHLVKRLKDVLESEVDEKYFLSDNMVQGLIKSGDKSYINQDIQASKVFSENGEAPNICAGTHGYANGYVETKTAAEVYQLNPSLESGGKQPFQQNRIYDIEGVSTTLCRDKADILIIPANNSKGYDIAEAEKDSINFSNPNSETRRGRVGHEVAQTLDTACNQGVLVKPVQIGQSEQTFAYKNGTLIGQDNQEAFCIRASQPNGVLTKQKIRRLTPKECFRLMDFNNDFKWNVSDSQAYKQAGNSIVVACLVEIIKKFKLN